MLQIYAEGTEKSEQVYPKIQTFNAIYDVSYIFYDIFKWKNRISYLFRDS